MLTSTQKAAYLNSDCRLEQPKTGNWQLETEMGYDSTCTLTTEGRTFAGTARLEEKALTFRGEARLAIPLAIIAGVRVREGRLHFTAGGRRIVLDLGTAAGKWAKRITHPPSRVEKLGVKAGMRVGLVGLDDPALIADIEARGATLERNARATGLDMVFFGANAPVDLGRLGALGARIQPAGAIWLVRAKGRGAPIAESESMAAAKRAGLVDVKVVSYSDTQSAEKYVIPLAKRPKPPAGKRPPTAR
jgi:hypothetical protein